MRGHRKNRLKAVGGKNVQTLFAGNKPALENTQVVEPTTDTHTEKPTKAKDKGSKKEAEFEDVK